MDMFVVPTISFRLLYGLLILQHARRELLWLGVTAHPSAQWIAQQLTEAYGWKETPRYLIRDRDRAYGEVFIRRVGAMGIRDRPISARSPWQNGYAERLIGSIRRDCLDHVVVFGERHLRQLLHSYEKYYNGIRHALVPAQGRTSAAQGAGSRPRAFTADLRRAAPSIRSDLSFRQEQDKDAPIWRPVQRTGVITSNPILGGLHHHYIRI
jgi:Integrase core domain